MKKYFLILASALLLAACSKSGAPRCVKELCSPDGTLKATFTLSADGVPCYSLEKNGVPVMLPSRLGFVFRGDLQSTDFVYERHHILKADRHPQYSMSEGFTLVDDGLSSFDETWEPVWGEESKIRNNYNELLVRLKQEEKDRFMNIRFRLFDDGLGFRYEFPAEGKLVHFVIKDELTEFACNGDWESWWIPGCYDSQEYEYGHCRLSEIPTHFREQTRSQASQTFFDTHAVQTSLQMKTDEGLYVNIHEAALVDFPCMHLLQKGNTLKAVLTPDAQGNRGDMQTPCKTPWRTIQVAQSATAQLESRLVLNLNDPCAYDDVSWIHPSKYMGVWWEMIAGYGKWSYTDDYKSVKLGQTDYSASTPHGKHSANNGNVRKYIDFASENGFDALLVEGWNIGWEDWSRKCKDYVFDFQTPNPDFDLPALNAYAHSKGIKLVMHHETSSSIRNYERHMEAAYNLMNEYGYDTVKSGYVGDILPKGLHHYSQWMINHYLYCVTEAARHHIMVNAHEAVRPTGLCRTYPNLIGNESAMGTEFQAFGGITPGHTAILPFTRLNGGPMDYTPGLFFFRLKEDGGKNSHVNSTICGQLGLYLTMYSPLQMAADTPEHYSRHMDAFQFIKDVAVDWSESHYLFAEPQDYIVVARKAKKDGRWFCGGITDGQAREFDVPMAFLGKGNYEATLYMDAPDADCYTNEEAYTITTRQVISGDTLHIRMAPGGGFAISFKRL